MYGTDYGAGFLNSPQVGSQGSPGGERRAASQSLRPVTIKQIMGAEQAHSDAELYIDNVEVAQVTLVAQVISTQIQTTNRMYYLDDGTGRLEARSWRDTQSEEDPIDDDVKEGTYVRVTGALKNFSGKRYINAANIRPCTDPHELYYHLLEVMYVSVFYQRGLPNGTTQFSSNVASSTAFGAGTSGYSSYTMPSTKMDVDQYSGVSPLARRIMDFILTQPPSEEGTHVAAIARYVKADAAAISTALDELMENGHLFTTSDESHFQASV